MSVCACVCVCVWDPIVSGHLFFFFFSDEYAVAKIVFHDFIFISYIAGSFPFGGKVVCLLSLLRWLLFSLLFRTFNKM